MDGLNRACRWGVLSEGLSNYFQNRNSPDTLGHYFAQAGELVLGLLRRRCGGLLLRLDVGRLFPDAGNSFQRERGSFRKDFLREKIYNSALKIYNSARRFFQSDSLQRSSFVALVALSAKRRSRRRLRALGTVRGLKNDGGCCPARRSFSSPRNFQFRRSFRHNFP